MAIHEGENHNPISKESIQRFIKERIAKRLTMNPETIDSNQTFQSLGLDSVQVVEISNDLAKWLGRRLSPTLLLDYPTIERVSTYLTDPLSKKIESGQASWNKGEFSYQPIAIIGMSCRFPGAHDLQQFFELLQNGRDVISEVPANRWDAKLFETTDQNHQQSNHARWGGFLGQVDSFDARFFGISPREAAKMDPQQRLLLEVSWEALEDAGIIPHQLSEKPVGVFIGISHSDYAHMQMNDYAYSDAYVATGSSFSIAANRISYFYGFRGPSISVDTACSSSLTAIYLACQSLWNGDCSISLVGGVNLLLSPSISIQMGKTGVLSPDGRCKTFDASADGLVRGEGVGVVVLKPLSQALRDKDPIYAIIRGGAMNNDGRTNGLMAPSGVAQEQLLRKAYEKAGISPNQIQYIEAHGAGTLLGDSVEVNALANVIGEGRNSSDVCLIGSVKTNIGSADAASGMASLIKVALMLKHQTIFPSLHMKKPNPMIPFADLPLKVASVLESWPKADHPAYAGISGFGFGGTNVHLVLEEPPIELEKRQHTASSPSTPYVLVLSAHHPEALKDRAQLFIDFLLDQGTKHSLKDICYTAGVRRTHFDYRLAVWGFTREEIRKRLKEFMENSTKNSLFGSQKAKKRKLAFVFSDYSPQWKEIVRDLRKKEPIFRIQMDRFHQIVDRYLEQVDSHVLKDDDVFSILGYVMMQIGLTSVWNSWGIKPDGVVATGMGEFAAAYVAGKMDLEDVISAVLDHVRSGKRDSWKKRISNSGTIPFFSTNTKKEQADLFHIIQQARMAGFDTFLTIDSGSQEWMSAIQTMHDEPEVICVESISEGNPPSIALRKAIGALFTWGIDPAWHRVYKNGKCISLPHYPWQRKRYWYRPDTKQTFIEASYIRESSKEKLAADVKALEGEIIQQLNQLNPAFCSEYLSPDEFSQLLLQQVNFTCIERVLDLGCGSSIHQSVLWRSYPNLKWDQLQTVCVCHSSDDSGSCCDVGNKLEISQGYDLALGLQVSQRVKNFNTMFARIGSHLKNGGLLVLGEMVIHDLEKSTMHFCHAEAFAEYLAENQLQILHSLNLSDWMKKRFATDPNQTSLPNDAHADHTMGEMDGRKIIGQLLQYKILTFQLMTIQKNNYLSIDVLRKINQEQLSHPFTCEKISCFHQECVNEVRVEPMELHLTIQEPAQMEAYLCQLVTQVLEYDSQDVNPHLSLNRLGFDSITAVELKHKIEKEIGVELSATHLLKEWTIAQLAEQLVMQRGEASRSMVNRALELEYLAKSVKNLDELLEIVDQLTDQEVDQLLQLLEERENA